jgi:hypothetical protein
MRVVIAVLLGLLAAGCSSAGSPSASARTGVVAFSRCMRSHGVPSYPDPGSSGLLPKQSPQQLRVSASQLETAQGSCIHLAPNGGRPSAVQVAQYRGAMLTYARCIRSHGVPNMPDPDSRGHLDIGPGTGVDVNSPRFEAAYQVCKSRLSP